MNVENRQLGHARDYVTNEARLFTGVHREFGLFAHTPREDPDFALGEPVGVNLEQSTQDFSLAMLMRAQGRVPNYELAGELLQERDLHADLGSDHESG